MDFKDVKLPNSIIIGGIAGFIIGFLIGVVNGGFILEIIARSILSGIILGATLFGVEQVIRKFAPEIFEEPTNQPSRVNIKEEDEISISDIYSSPYEDDTNLDNERELDSYIDSSMEFSENSVFGDKIQNTSELEEVLENTDEIPIIETNEEKFSSLEFDKVEQSKPKDFEPMTFSTAELGVTKESKGGATEDFIIPGKGKPIPKDYKKLAEAIRTKLKEE